MSGKVVVALSGGVDSSVAALTLIERGFSVTGATLLLHDECGKKEARSCCAYEDIVIAKEAARKLGIPHFILDQRELFADAVKKYFIDGLRAGSTPNPCVICNEKIKFGSLLDWSSANGYDFLATGHYAKLTDDDGELALRRGADLSKDQSYFLFSVSEESFRRVIFPLDSETKESVRNRAREACLPTSEKPESQDICFGSGAGLADFLARSGFPEKEGPILLCDGTEVGRHKGLWNFTVGQRRGIAVPYSEPLYVNRIDIKNNALIAGPKEKAARKRFKVNDWLWRGRERCGIIDLQVRYRQTPRQARIIEEGAEVFAEWTGDPEIAAPGQAAVGYIGDKVVGGGWITEEKNG